jgi:heme-degrading monooxygenase HmoA
MNTDERRLKKAKVSSMRVPGLLLFRLFVFPNLCSSVSICGYIVLASIAMIEILWEYRVRRDRREDFERIYSSDGRWAQFFASDPAYISTVLLRDALDAERYYTRDVWQSRAAYNSFRDSHAAEYQQIDRETENLTAEERFIGIFDAL